MAKGKTQHVDLGSHGSFNVHKGALHRALGVPEGEKIPASKMAGHHSGKVGRMIASAKGFKAMHHNNDEKHDLHGASGGGGVNLERAGRSRGMSAHHRGGMSTNGQAQVPGGRGSSPIPRGAGGISAEGRIQAHFQGAHHGGHEHLQGKHHAGRMGHHAGAHAKSANHPHNLPVGFGKGPVGLDD